MTLEVEIKVSPCDDSRDGCRRKLIFFQHSFGVNVSNGWIKSPSTPEANPTFTKCAGMLISDPISCSAMAFSKDL